MCGSTTANEPVVSPVPLSRATLSSLPDQELIELQMDW